MYSPEPGRVVSTGTLNPKEIVENLLRECKFAISSLRYMQADSQWLDPVISASIDLEDLTGDEPPEEVAELITETIDALNCANHNSNSFLQWSEADGSELLWTEIEEIES